MAKTTTSKKTGEPKTMADLLAMAGAKPKGFQLGEKIEATVLQINPKSVVLDIGGKSEGVVAEKAFQEAKDFIKGLSVGDKVTGEVIVSETREGYTILSLRHAAKDFVWKRIHDAFEAETEVNVEIRAVNQSGILVDIFGIGGFIPTSQLGKEVLKSLNSLVGKSLKAKIIDYDKGGNRVILSERQVSEKESVAREKDAIIKLKEGEIYEGEVTTTTDFGLFVQITVDLAKDKVLVEGLVHISEISWDKVGKPSEEYEKGDKVKVRVLEVKNGKVALSIKHAKEDPWTAVAKKYKKDDRITGKVTRVSDFGTFVSLEPGIEGLIHITKIPPTMKLHVGDEVNCYVEEIDPEEKKIGLGIVLTSKPIGYR